MYGSEVDEHLEVATSLRESRESPTYVPWQHPQMSRALWSELSRFVEAFYSGNQEEHPDVARSLYNLARGSVHILEGYEVAKRHCERALEILLRSVGPEHPHDNRGAAPSARRPPEVRGTRRHTVS